MTAAAVALVPTLAALRDLAIETLFQLMSTAASPRERRLAATAALRYIAQAEKYSLSDRDPASTPAAVEHAEAAPIPAPSRPARTTDSPQSTPSASFALTFHAGHDCGIDAARPRTSFNSMFESLFPRRARSRRVAGAIAIAAGAAPALGP
jgi:hypothetical protein